MSSGIPDAVVEDVKSRIDLADLVASYGVEVKNAGSSLKACCPFHNEKTPSFNINRDKGFYHCFGCGESGDAIKFVMKMDGSGFVDAVKKLASQCGIEIEEKADPEARLRKRLFELMSSLAAFYSRCLKSMKGAAAAREYLDRRRIDEDAREAFGIGYAPEGAAAILKWGEKNGFTPEEIEAAGVIRRPQRPGDSGYHRFSGRLMFPIADRRGRVVAFSGRLLEERKNAGKYVNSPETPIFKKGEVLYAFDKAAGAIARSPNREVVCCEGQIDTIRLHTCGFANAVASQGTAFTAEHARMIKRVADSAVLMYDDDAAGHKAAVKIAAMLLAMDMPVRVVSLPDGDDPDSFLLKHPPEVLRELVAGAESIVSFQCRAEKAKEKNPGAIDAVARISKAVLSTIAASPSPVLRASMAGEASKLLSIPSAAIFEEIEKIRSSAKPSAKAVEPVPEADGAEDAPPAAEDAGPEAEDAADAAPPPPLETAFLGFLIASEDDSSVAGEVRRLVPPDILCHPFSMEFAKAYLAPDSAEGDPVADFADSLDPRRRAWFDKALAESTKTSSSPLDPGEILRDFARSLWCAALERRRGSLSAAPDAPDVAERLAISTDLKRFRLAPWDEVEKMISERTKGET